MSKRVSLGFALAAAALLLCSPVRAEVKVGDAARRLMPVPMREKPRTWRRGWDPGYAPV